MGRNVSALISKFVPHIPEKCKDPCTEFDHEGKYAPHVSSHCKPFLSDLHSSMSSCIKFDHDGIQKVPG